jgi:hypothetical protein
VIVFKAILRRFILRTSVHEVRILDGQKKHDSCRIKQKGVDNFENQHQILNFSHVIQVLDNMGPGFFTFIDGLKKRKKYKYMKNN